MSIEKALRELEAQNVTDVYLIPLYPHFAMSSFETVVEKNTNGLWLGVIGAVGVVTAVAGYALFRKRR